MWHLSQGSQVPKISMFFVGEQCQTSKIQKVKMVKHAKLVGGREVTFGRDLGRCLAPVTAPKHMCDTLIFKIFVHLYMCIFVYLYTCNGSQAHVRYTFFWQIILYRAGLY